MNVKIIFLALIAANSSDEKLVENRHDVCVVSTAECAGGKVPVWPIQYSLLLKDSKSASLK